MATQDTNDCDVCFMYLVHDNPRQLARLLEALDNPWAAHLVHVDGNSSLPPFYEATKHLPRVKFLEEPKRIGVFWGGYSVVQATINLMSEAIFQFPDAKRFCLLSGADYPIKNHQTLRAALMDSKMEYMHIGERIDHDPGQWHYRHVGYSYFLDYRLAKNPIAAKFIRRIRIKREPWKGFPSYKGSQWFAITREFTRLLLDFSRQSPEYVKFHHRTFAPDEIFFQSIAAAEGIKTADMKGEHSESNVYGAHFIDWTSAISATPGPKILTTSDHSRLLNSSALFARKFHPDVSRELLDQLDGELKHRDRKKRLG